MKALVVSILILLIASQAFSKWLLLLEFRLNQDYIATNLCENRAKPVSTCGGKCQLKKGMEKEETTPSSPVQTSKATFSEVLYPLKTIIADTTVDQEGIVIHQSHYLLKHYAAPAPAILQPPA